MRGWRMRWRGARRRHPVSEVDALIAAAVWLGLATLAVLALVLLPRVL